jgi:hypothetical protein
MTAGVGSRSAPIAFGSHMSCAHYILSHSEVAPVNKQLIKQKRTEWIYEQQHRRKSRRHHGREQRTW